MPILLMSSGTSFAEVAEEKLNTSFSDKKIAYVTSAVAVALDKRYYFDRKERMKEKAWYFEEIDLAGKAFDELEEFFSDKDIIYVEGGSTFYLLKAIKDSGFEKIVRKHLEQGKVYVGSSAGAYVACPNIEVAVRFNRRHNWDHCGLKDYAAMNLVPYLIKAHYKPKEDDEELEKFRAESKFEVRALRDGEVIFERWD